MTRLKCTTLPDRDEMQRRLETVIVTQDSIKHLIPLLLPHATKSRNGYDIHTMFRLALDTYSQTSKTAHLISGVLRIHIRDLITALMGKDDDEVSKDALSFAANARATPRSRS